ncbi:hypothetical protein CC1G_04913 [Coprinopsis cinerea okayama7|uniref:Uncharacterized protein n=1 Tax=Coprinopsis cinerea (strain Okayama-7 / 130 / ATCC MYA-4618 / FGSC 9003) TaxID=240176 RepID=A8PFI3_COPC7|nr:hypothetical protein CC1G_04913 [Coprinopsis cinerea okayama7\|eukprot:XP_001841069.2 hypothetical protein CC1G_04913 [Coprinopsis cinerea okayama7\
MPFATQGVFSNDVPLSAVSENGSPPLDEERGTDVEHAHRWSTRSDEQLRFPQQMAMSAAPAALSLASIAILQQTPKPYPPGGPGIIFGINRYLWCFDMAVRSFLLRQ